MNRISFKAVHLLMTQPNIPGHQAMNMSSWKAPVVEVDCPRVTGMENHQSRFLQIRIGSLEEVIALEVQTVPV